MDLKTKGLDRQYIIDHLTVKTYPKPGYDVYLMRIYHKGAYLTEIEVDGLELEMWRHEGADELGFTKIEKPTLICAKDKDMKKAKAVVGEATRKEGWD